MPHDNPRIAAYEALLEGLKSATDQISPDHKEAHRRQLDFMSRQLEFLIEDLHSRHQSPLFQKARALFAEGYRLTGAWDIDGYMTGDAQLTRNGQELLFWALASEEEEDRDDLAFYQALGLTSLSFSAEEMCRVLWHLSNLTEEQERRKA